MDTSVQHVPEPAEDLPPQMAPVVADEAFDSSADLYARTELERRHERFDRMVEKAQTAT